MLLPGNETAGLELRAQNISTRLELQSSTCDRNEFQAYSDRSAAFLRLTTKSED